jgi:predicted small metal-binding protein
MRMRVVECDVCGETISAASDAELVARVSDHLESEHDQEPDTEAVEAMVEEEAYEATDS